MDVNNSPANKGSFEAIIVAITAGCVKSTTTESELAMITQRRGAELKLKLKNQNKQSEF